MDLRRNPPISMLEVAILSAAIRQPEAMLQIRPDGELQVGDVSFHAGQVLLNEMLEKAAIEPRGDGYTLTERGKDLAIRYAGMTA